MATTTLMICYFERRNLDDSLPKTTWFCLRRFFLLIYTKWRWNWGTSCFLSLPGSTDGCRFVAIASQPSPYLSYSLLQFPVLCCHDPSDYHRDLAPHLNPHKRSQISHFSFIVLIDSSTSVLQGMPETCQKFLTKSGGTRCVDLRGRESRDLKKSTDTRPRIDGECCLPRKRRPWRDGPSEARAIVLHGWLPL